jgi:hypothetical protein
MNGERSESGEKKMLGGFDEAVLFGYGIFFSLSIFFSGASVGGGLRVRGGKASNER